MGSVDARIVQYGIFDSSVRMPEVTETRNRLLEKYEFELYPADCAGTAYIDDVPYLPKAGLLLCVKPGQHRRRLKERIGAARRLLLTTDTPIADIAAECGFSSQSHFNDSFKKQTGRSPAQYRKEMLSRVDL